MVKKILSLLFVVLMASCAADLSPPVDAETKARLGEIASQCIVRASSQIDDGISPANVIATGVISKCQDEINAYDYARLPPANSGNIYAATVWQNRYAGWGSLITSTVLEIRSRNRKQ